jgi:predicted Ser/Thr protein kinase
MTPKQWQRVEQLLETALRREPGKRAAFLHRACAGNAELFRELASLLAYEERAERFMASPALEMLGAGDAGGPQSPRFREGLPIGPYRVAALIGRGGMGEVYQATDTRLGREVALKFLPPHYAATPHALERFRREARAISSLNHPNICTLYDIGEHDGQPFLVMERIEGESLRQRLTGAPLPAAELISIASQICDALEAAHGNGIVHRDIKPANILLTEHGRVKILDFGLAKLRAEPNAPPEAIRASASRATGETITIQGRAMGTASYMSPEQAHGDDVDERSDLFSLGVILYQITTGARPFDRGTPEQTCEAVLSQRPAPPRQLNPAIPAELERIILRTLEKERTARYAGAAELRADLERLRPTSTRGPAWGAAIAGVLILAVGAAVAAVRSGWFGTASLMPELAARQVTANTLEDPVIRASISPDGAFVAYPDLAGIHVRNIKTGETRSIPAPEGACFR